MSSSVVKKEQWMLDAKSALLERKAQIEELLQEFSQYQAPETSEDLGDQAFSSSMEALKGSLHDAEYREYRSVLAALEAIEKGTYGICVDCDQRIAERRLQSQPNAARCITCQEALEERMRRG